MEQMTFRELTDQVIALYSQSKYDEALQLVGKNAEQFPEELARTTFWKMCLLSLCDRPDNVMSVFRQGLDDGLWWAESQFVDSDLDAVRDLPEFKRLMDESSMKCIEMQSHIQPARTLLIPEDTSRELPLLIGLHGRNGHNDSNLEHWDVARQHGWLVLSPQSRQALFEGAYCWDDNDQGLSDILFQLEEVMKSYNIDRERTVIAGFSQGAGMAIYTALSGKISARGFIGVGTFIAEPDLLIPLASRAPSIRGYFVTGEKDHTLDKAKAIQKLLKENQIRFKEETFPELGHEFPPDFESSFDQAIRFILE
ncbi:MAG TPA: dienelactone hydrolase family protein [Anaerolineales bacterium]|nr:dienelactone hydrolase family protein [Anaerolineales bacterium]